MGRNIHTTCTSTFKRLQFAVIPVTSLSCTSEFDVKLALCLMLEIRLPQALLFGRMSTACPSLELLPSGMWQAVTGRI